MDEIAAWHERETSLRAEALERYSYEREVWWTAIGRNMGFEENGKGRDFARPVLILRKYSERFFLGIPFSTTLRQNRYFYQFKSSPSYTSALLSQIRALDARRLIKKDGTISSEDYMHVKLRLIEMIAH